MFSRSIFVGLLFAIGGASLVFAEIPAPIEPDFTASIVEKLARGETVLFENPKASGHAGIAIQLHATRDEVWAILMDPESATAFQPTLRSCKVLERTKTSQLIAQEVKIGFLPVIQFQIRSKRVTPKKQIEFHLTEGDLSELTGGWLVLDGADFGQSGSVFLFHQVFLDPGFLVPQSLVQRSLQTDLPPMMKAIRARIFELRQAAESKVAAAR
ncbi:MAG: hypothetical protein ACI8UO_002474 [Verrucomicrobiales bacterium]|jgi:hypothetical protein